MSTLQDFMRSGSAILQQLPGMVFIKDMASVYTASSAYAARLCGFKDTEQFIGHTDFDLRCDAAHSAETFRDEDKVIFTSGKQVTSLQLHTYSDHQVHIFLLKKTPLKDEQGHMIGLSGMADEISNPSVGRAIYHLAGLQKNCRVKSRVLKIHPQDEDQTLSPRESELLFYLLRGFTNKEIANFMTVSPRTIESYLETIKHKFHCVSRYDLLHYGLAHGLDNLIPSAILKRCLNQSLIID